jgi:amidase
MCRRVEDLKLIKPLISGPDYRDAAVSPVPWPDPEKVELKKLKVAFCPQGGANTDQDTRNTIRQAAKWLEEVTTSVKEDYPKEVLTDLAAARGKLSSGDGGAFYQRLADKWSTKNISPQRKASTAAAHPLSSAELVEAWEQHDLAKSQMLDWMKTYDVFICPVAPRPAQPIDADPNAGPGGRGGAGPRGEGSEFPNAGTFNCTGWPVVVVRCGTSTDGKNLPIGVQVACAPWREDICLAVATYLETRSGGWQRPPV